MATIRTQVVKTVAVDMRLSELEARVVLVALGLVEHSDRMALDMKDAAKELLKQLRAAMQEAEG